MKCQKFMKRDVSKWALPVLCGLMTTMPTVVFGAKIASLHVMSYHHFVNVTGKVIDEKGEPISGVTIFIKGEKTSVGTDQNGVFRMNLPTGKEILIASYVGYKSQEIMVNGQTELTIVMEASSDNIDEVIVMGYGGTATKATLTGSVDALNAEEIEDLPLGNLGAGLAGRILGLSVDGGTSRPGSTAQLTIRNPMSLSKDPNNEPLYVIDDVIQVNANGSPDNSLFNSLDPSEVVSITIMKDAAAAIYGSRAANGAVIVKTKRGQIGKPRVTYSGSFAMNDEAYRTKVLSAYEFTQYMNIRNGKYGSNQAISSPDDPRYSFTQEEQEYFKDHEYDWLDKAWKPASNMRHTLNVSGGADRSTYFANVSYYTQDGNLSSLDYEKWTFRAGADVNLLDGLKAGLQVSGVYDDLTKTFNKIGGENDENDYRNLLLAPRYVPMYVGDLPVKIPGTDALSRYHFYEVERLGNLAGGVDKTTTFNLFAEYELPFLTGLKARIQYGRNMGTGRSTQVGTKYTLYDFGTAHIIDENTPYTSKEWENGNRLYYSNKSTMSTQTNFMLSYANQFGKHRVNGFFSVEKGEAKSTQEDVWKYDPSLATNGEMNTAFGAYEGKGAGNESGALGYLGRAGYDYAGKYLVDFVARTDASTKFAPENYWGNFYSLGFGWVLSEEKFFNFPSVNFLKLRYNFGKLGKDDTPAWLWRQRYTFQNNKGAVFGDDKSPIGIGMKMESSPNRNAHWSDEYKHNFGLDAEFLNSRLSTTVEAFYNKGRNMLMERTAVVPISVGGTVAAENYGKIDFFGYELAVGWRESLASGFRYGINGRFSWYDNKVIEQNFNDIDILYPWNQQRGKSSDNGVWGYDYLGMFKNQQDIDNYVAEYNIEQSHGVKAADFKPGMLYYRDIRGPLQSDGTFAEPDGIIDNNDRIQLAKKASSHHTFSLTLTAGYKGFSFDAVIVGSFGGWSEMDARKGLNQDISRVYQNAPKYWNDIYDLELNPSGHYPNPNWDAVSLSPTSDFWRVSSFRMRMRNFNLNYSIPKNLTERLHISNARVIFTGVNPLNLYNPFDYKDSEGGWDMFPTLRTFSLGVNVSL